MNVYIVNHFRYMRQKSAVASLPDWEYDDKSTICVFLSCSKAKKFVKNFKPCCTGLGEPNDITDISLEETCQMFPVKKWKEKWKVTDGDITVSHYIGMDKKHLIL